MCPSSFPRKRESMLSISGRDGTVVRVGSRWIPAFAGMTIIGHYSGGNAPLFCQPAALAVQEPLASHVIEAAGTPFRAVRGWQRRNPRGLEGLFAANTPFIPQMRPFTGFCLSITAYWILYPWETDLCQVRTISQYQVAKEEKGWDVSFDSPPCSRVRWRYCRAGHTLRVAPRSPGA